MISHNLLLYELLDKTINVDFEGQTWNVNYAEGDLLELAQFINGRALGNLTKYPIIWLQDGYTVQRDKRKNVTKLFGCKFFFLTVAPDINSRYKQRYSKTYNEFLYKILLKFDKIIETRNGISSDIIDDFRTYPLSEAASALLKEANLKATIQDVWDCVQLTTDIEISNDCFPEFKIKI